MDDGVRVTVGGPREEKWRRGRDIVMRADSLFIPCRMWDGENSPEQSKEMKQN